MIRNLLLAIAATIVLLDSYGEARAQATEGQAYQALTDGQTALSAATAKQTPAQQWSQWAQTGVEQAQTAYSGYVQQYGQSDYTDQINYQIIIANSQYNAGAADYNNGQSYYYGGANSLTLGWQFYYMTDYDSAYNMGNSAVGSENTASNYYDSAKSWFTMSVSHSGQALSMMDQPPPGP